MMSKILAITCFTVCVAVTCFGSKCVKIAQSSRGVWAVCVDDVPDGYSSLDSDSCLKWAKERYDVVKFCNVNGVFYGDVGLKEDPGDVGIKEGAGDDGRKEETELKSLCGVKFGDIDIGGVAIALGGDKGLMTRQFVPEKRFDEFDEYYCLSTPKSHRVCKIYLVKSMLVGLGASPDQLDELLRQKFLTIKPIIEQKYRSCCLEHYPWTMKNKKTGKKEEIGIGFRFSNGTLDFSIADRKDLEDLYGGIAWMGRALLIVATDKNLYELGKREADEVDKEKLSASADAL